MIDRNSENIKSRSQNYFTVSLHERSSRKQCCRMCEKESTSTKCRKRNGGRWEGSGNREDRTYSGKVELGCNGGWLGRLLRLLEGVKRYGAVREGWKADGWRRERGWLLKRGHVSRSQSNTLTEGRELRSGRMSVFGLDNRVALRTLDLKIHRTLGCDRREVQFRSFVKLRLWYVIIHYDMSEYRAAKFYSFYVSAFTYVIL